MKLQISLFLLFLSGIMLFSGNELFASGVEDKNSVSTETEGNLVVIDSYGRKISLSAPANRIISLSPGITETVFALGYGNTLIGRTSFCDYPPEASAVAVVGNLMEPDVETILTLEPDIVIASTHFPRESLEKLESVGLQVVVLMGQESFEGVYDGIIEPMARILGDVESGRKLISEMRGTVESALARVRSFTRFPSVYYVVGFGEGGDWTAGGDTFIGEMIEMAGGSNIAADATGWSFSRESLVAGNPDLILLPSWAGDIFPSSPGYADLRACREGNTVAIDENAIVRQGPRLAEGFAMLVDAIGKVL